MYLKLFAYVVVVTVLLTNNGLSQLPLYVEGGPFSTENVARRNRDLFLKKFSSLITHPKTSGSTKLRKNFKK